MSLNYEAEFGRGGLLKTIIVKELKYDLVEFTIKTKLTDEITGKVIVDSANTSFFDNREFKEFFGTFINEMKVRLDNANSIQE
jgi:hypothetical protein